MSLHLTDNTPLDFLDDPTTDYLRINMGRFIASWATGDFDDLSITQHTETGSLIQNPVTQRLGSDNWPVLSFYFPSSLTMVLADPIAAPSPSSCQSSTHTIIASHVARTARQWSMDSNGAM